MQNDGKGLQRLESGRVPPHRRIAQKNGAEIVQNDGACIGGRGRGDGSRGASGSGRDRRGSVCVSGLHNFIHNTHTQQAGRDIAHRCEKLSTILKRRQDKGFWRRPRKASVGAGSTRIRYRENRCYHCIVALLITFFV